MGADESDEPARCQAFQAGNNLPDDGNSADNFRGILGNFDVIQFIVGAALRYKYHLRHFSAYLFAHKINAVQIAELNLGVIASPTDLPGSA